MPPHNPTKSRPRQTKRVNTMVTLRNGQTVTITKPERWFTMSHWDILKARIKEVDKDTSLVLIEFQSRTDGHIQNSSQRLPNDSLTPHPTQIDIALENIQ